MSRTVRQNHPRHRVFDLSHYWPWVSRPWTVTPKTARDGKALGAFDFCFLMNGIAKRDQLRRMRHRRAHLVRIGKFEIAGPERAIWRPRD